MTQQMANNSQNNNRKPQEAEKASVNDVSESTDTPENLANVQRIQRKIAVNPKAATPSEVLQLQRTLGNQQVMRMLGVSSIKGTVQRHAADEEQQIDRMVVQRHTEDEEQEVDRIAIERHTEDEEQEVDRKIQRSYHARGRNLGHNHASTHLSVQRQIAASSATIQRVPPTTDQLNNKFQRSAGAGFQIKLEGIQAMAQTIGQTADGEIFNANERAKQNTKSVQQYQEKLNTATDDKKPGIQSMINAFQDGFDKSNERVAEMQHLKTDLANIGNRIEVLAAVGSDPQDDDIAALERVKSDLEKLVTDYKLSQDTIKSGKAIYDNADKVVGDGFGDRMRTAVDEGLSLLPTSHTGGNASFRSIGPGQKMQGLGQASGYDYEDKTIAMVRPDSPFGGQMSEKTYTKLDRGSSFQLSLMDKGASEEYSGIRSSKDLKLGSRTVMGGKKTRQSPHMGKLANGSLVNWTIRHETGHAVDQQIQFTKKRGKLPAFGGWREHEGDAQIKEVIDAMLSKSGVLNFDTPLNPDKKLGEVLAVVLQKGHEEAITELKNMAADAKNPKNASKSESPGYKNWLKNTATKTQCDGLVAAIEWARVALAQPWMTPNGASDKLDVGGRVYQVDHYGKWVSYLAEARANALSSYQFSSPGEWFAEAYAAYYGTDESARKGLAPAVASWFATNLGAFGQTEKGGKLTENDTLGTIEEEVDENGNTANDEMPQDVSNMMKVAQMQGA